MSDVPSYWLGPGHAAGFSRSVARASQAVGDANAALYEALKKGYPHGSEVYVIHHRGCFAGTVEGWDTYGTRVIVKNARTGKTSKWWAAHVQLTDPAADGADGVAATAPITSVAEFCAEAERIGLTATDLAEALAKRPEFADCLPNAGVTGTEGGRQR